MLNKINKRGDKYYIMISLILGLIVLSLSLYFIFQEFFTSDMIDQESCRQSVYLRATLPDVEISKWTVGSFKDEFPLKCKTQVVEISEQQIKDKVAEKIIAEKMVECWAIFGNGDYSLFPAKMIGKGKYSYCVPCARIYLTGDAKKYLESNPLENINIERGLNLIGFEGISYKNYLNEVGQSFPAFSPASGRAFDLSGDSFSVNPKDQEESVLRNRATGGTDGDGGFWESLVSDFDLSKVSLPKYFNHSQGDLLISFGTTSLFVEGGIGNHIPYLLYFQIDQPMDPFVEAREKMYLDGRVWKNGFLCENWDGIPA